MAGRFTLGIEEEFQLVNRQDRQLCSSINTILERGTPYFVEDVIDDLGSRHEIDYLRALINSPDGTGADRQIAVYKQTGDINKVIELLMEQTMQGITLEAADLSQSFLKFKMYEATEAVHAEQK